MAGVEMAGATALCWHFSRLMQIKFAMHEIGSSDWFKYGRITEAGGCMSYMCSILCIVAWIFWGKHIKQYVFYNVCSSSLICISLKNCLPKSSSMSYARQRETYRDRVTLRGLVRPFLKTFKGLVRSRALLGQGLSSMILNQTWHVSMHRTISITRWPIGHCYCHHRCCHHSHHHCHCRRYPAGRAGCHRDRPHIPSL